MSDVFSPYQIDYSVKNTSKTFGFSKKKVTFKFGFANPPAVESGATGVDCRGSEHELIFTWSLNSGKRQILSDGKNEYYSETGKNGWTADQVFQHHFNIRVPGLSGPLRAHLITQPANRDVPHIKPFDLRINGVSYFAMPKIFELGTPKMVTRPVKGKSRNRGGGVSGGGRNSDACLSHEEKQAIAAAKLASLNDMNRSNTQAGHCTGPLPPTVNDATEDLLSFDAPPVPAPPPMYSGYGQPPPPQKQAYNNYSLSASFTGNSVQFSQYLSRGSFASVPLQQPQPPSQHDNVFDGSFSSLPYGQPSAQMAPQQQQPVYDQQQLLFTQPLAPLSQECSQLPYNNAQQYPTLSSPTNETQVTYQSYGSAPTFAQPPPQQLQQSQQSSFNYGSPHPAQGYP